MADGSRLGAPAERNDPGTLRVGSVAGIDVLVRTSWLIVALFIAVAVGPAVDVVAPNLGSLRYLAGFAIAILLTGSLLLHELSHAVAAQRFGIRVRSITLHFLGGVTAIDGEPATPRQELVISGVGPITSLAIGAVALGVLQVTPSGLLALAVGALAYSNLLIGVLNLVPGIPLDGGRILRAGVWSISGSPHRGTVVAGWSGRMVAILVFASPLILTAVGWRTDVIDYLFALVLSWFLWSAASNAIVSGTLRARLPKLRARTLARRTVVIDEQTSLAEAVRAAESAQAGAIVTLDRGGRPIGIVEESAVAATPVDRRGAITVGAVARLMASGTTIDADLEGESLVVAMHQQPAPQYLLTERDGSVYGVLVRTDVDAAFAATR